MSRPLRRVARLNPSAAVHGLGRVAARDPTKAASSSRYACSKRSTKSGHAGPAGGGTPGSTERMGVRGPRPTETLSPAPEELGPDVVAERVVTGDGHHAERAVGQRSVATAVSTSPYLAKTGKPRTEPVA